MEIAKIDELIADLRPTHERSGTLYHFEKILVVMCCEILEQRKAAGQECAEAHDCPGNAANSKISRIHSGQAQMASRIFSKWY
ncbi:hypothetical protein [Coraliomargarita parva]|uniref:hypothetical protein n=1 Tax=Coraliomargarita parva TaxID=3014050 RepID=UPI0022B5346F|nr:hypothetical protein [Coraliomargarita parva]